MPQPGTPPQPHDRFFKLIFSETERAAGFLRGALPPELLEGLDLSTLQLDPNSYIDEQLQESFADLVYHCQYKQRAVRLVFLLEHKSYVPAYPHLQLLRYLLNLWESQVRDKQALSPVIPIIIYHGTQTWHYRPFEAFLPGGADPLLLPYVPRFDYLFANLQAEPAEALQARFEDLIVQRTLMLMQTIFDKALVERLAPIFQGLNEALEAEQGQKLIRSFTMYLYAVVDAPKKDAVMKKVQELIEDFPYYENSIMALLIGKGREETLDQTILKLLKHGMAPDQVALMLELPPERIEAAQQRQAGKSDQADQV
jgi:predicted transposase/invertase (TIGR01784 family)